MCPESNGDSVVSFLESTMETIPIVILLPLAFALSNLIEQLAAMKLVRRGRAVIGKRSRATPEDPSHSQFDGIARTRTDRHDLQLGMGRDFAESDPQENVWPRQ